MHRKTLAEILSFEIEITKNDGVLLYLRAYDFRTLILEQRIDRERGFTTENVFSHIFDRIGGSKIPVKVIIGL